MLFSSANVNFHLLYNGPSATYCTLIICKCGPFWQELSVESRADTHRPVTVQACGPLVSVCKFLYPLINCFYFIHMFIYFLEITP